MHLDEVAAKAPPGAGPARSCTPAATFASKLGRWANRQFAEALRPVGLKPRQLATLVELRAAPLTQQALGDAVRIDAAQLVGLLNDLETAGLVRRRRDPGDRRRHIVELSEPGRTRLAEADRALAAVDERMMTGLSDDERTQFVALLRFVAEHGGFDEECAGKTPCDVLEESLEDPCEGST